MSVDQRHEELAVLRSLVDDAETESSRIGKEENVGISWEWIWRIDPIPFSEDLIQLAEDVVRQTAGTTHTMSSGPLHDAAEVAHTGVPTVMVFVRSVHGLSHTKEEDTRPEDIVLAVEALDLLSRRTMNWIEATS